MLVEISAMISIVWVVTLSIKLRPMHERIGNRK